MSFSDRKKIEGREVGSFVEKTLKKSMQRNFNVTSTHNILRKQMIT